MRHSLSSPAGPVSRIREGGMAETVEKTGIDEQIRERLRYLVRERSQSDLARKTGTLVSTVNRYLKSTKIPGEFLAAVIHGIGVNPAWLMVGEGTPYLADVGAGTSEMATDLLSMVEAMNQVARMKLGALTGKSHLKVLRELNDALAVYEQRREAINLQSRRVFRELLDDLKKALMEMNPARARELREAAAQVSRLCDDPELTVEFDNLQEFYEHIFGDQQRALELSRKVFVQSLGASEVALDKEHCALAINLVVRLHQADRCHEARRICRATLALYEDKGHEWGRYRQLTALHGALNIELGEINEGLRQLHETYPSLPSQLKRTFSGKLVESLVFSGITDLNRAEAIGVESVSRSISLIRFAGLLGDRARLRRAAESLPQPEPGQPQQGAVYAAYGAALESAWSGDRGAAGEFLKTVEEESERIAVRQAQRFAYVACATHVALEAGDEAEARRLFLEAQELLGGLDDAVTPQMIALALHWHNAQRVAPGKRDKTVLHELRQRAFEFFSKHLRAGYGCFRDFATAAPESLD